MICNILMFSKSRSFLVFGEVVYLGRGTRGHALGITSRGEFTRDIMVGLATGRIVL